MTTALDVKFWHSSSSGFIIQDQVRLHILLCSDWSTHGTPSVASTEAVKRQTRPFSLIQIIAHNFPSSACSLWRPVYNLKRQKFRNSPSVSDTLVVKNCNYELVPKSILCWHLPSSWRKQLWTRRFTWFLKKALTWLDNTEMWKKHLIKVNKWLTKYPLWLWVNCKL